MSAQEVNSTVTPALFVNLTALPGGYEYVIIGIGNYNYGQGNGIYRGGVRQISSGNTYWGNEFGPNLNSYLTAQAMIDTELGNVYSGWYNGIYQVVQAIAPAAALIGF